MTRMVVTAVATATVMALTNMGGNLCVAAGGCESGASLPPGAPLLSTFFFFDAVQFV